MGWPALCDLSKQRSLDDSLQLKRPLNFVVVVAHDDTFEEQVGAALEPSDCCYAVEFVNHHRNTCSGERELQLIRSIWQAEGSKDGSKDVWMNHGYRMQWKARNDSFPEVWMDEVTTERAPFFLLLEAPSKDNSKDVATVFEYLRRDPVLLENTLAVFTTVPRKDTERPTSSGRLVLWNSLLFQTPKLETNVAVHCECQGERKSGVVLENKPGGCIVQVEDDSEQQVDLACVQIVTSPKVEQLITTNADIAPTIRGLVRATANAKRLKDQPSLGRDLSPLLLGMDSPRRFLERDNLGFVLERCAEFNKERVKIVLPAGTDVGCAKTKAFMEAAAQRLFNESKDSADQH